MLNSYNGHRIYVTIVKMNSAASLCVYYRYSSAAPRLRLAGQSDSVDVRNLYSRRFLYRHPHDINAYQAKVTSWVFPAQLLVFVDLGGSDWPLVGYFLGVLYRSGRF